MYNKLQLNPIQRKFWLDHMLKYPSTEYNDTNYTFVVEGDLDITILKESYRLIMLEYPPFHSIIQVEKGEPYFVFADALEQFPFQLIEKQEKTDEREVVELIESLVYVPFDLQKEYPCRFYVISSGKRYYLLHLFNHVVMDGQTFKSFFRRLSVIYNDLLSGVYSEVNQRSMLEHFNRDYIERYDTCYLSDVEYWKNYIHELPLILPVAQYFSHKDIFRKSLSRNYSYNFTLGKDFYWESQDFCKKNHTSPFRLYSTVWALTLSRITHSKDLFLDHTLNMRGSEYETLFGVFINDLPVKYDFHDGELSFIELIDYANENRHNERKHQFAFYEDILPDSKDDLGKREMVNIGINYPLSWNSQCLDLHACQVMPFMHVNVELPLDLVLSIENDEIFSCNLRYQPHLSLDFVRILAETFQAILVQVLTCSDVKIKDIQLLTDNQIKTLLEREHKSLYHGVIAPQTFVDQFNKIVAVSSDKIAVEFGNLSITYSELDRQSSCVARALQKMHLHSQYIGLMTPKNLSMVIGMVGILKSGNVYVPIDYEYPADRITFMLDDCNISVVLSTEELAVSCGKVPVLMIENLMQNDSTDSVLPQISFLDDAYVIYTSGTTGKPKGIPIKHFMLAQTIATAIDIMQLNEHSRTLQFANICFDASIIEIFPTLAAGATLVLPQEEMRKDPFLLVSFLKEKRITVMALTPAFLSMLPHVDLPQLATIVVGGDSTSSDVIQYWSNNRLFINEYGPTENSVDATYSVLRPDSNSNDIGVSVSGTVCYVLDEYLHLMPDYAIGELYIGGIKLTEGYLNRPNLNAEKFIPNPFVSEEDKKKGINLRLYKSGDLVMRRDDGHLIFIGRSDYQVKLNGYRIELGDVESKIMEFGGGIKNVVTIVSESEGRKRLVAYVLVSSLDDFSSDKLKDFLFQHLPAYMVPSVIIPMTSFPYNTSGKVDRKKLPSPTFHHEVRNVEQPVTETERKLATLWTKLLSEQIIGREDSFISLGGDSMAIIQLAFAIHDEFGYAIKASEIYQHITLKTLADFIDLHSDAEPVEFKVNESVEQEKEGDVVPLSPAQFSLWMECMKSDEIKKVYNLPCMFECPADMSVLVFEEAFNQLIKIQDSFRMSFPLDKKGNPYISIIKYHPCSIDVIEIKESELAEYLNRDMQIDFDLAHAPLFRCTLYRIDGQRYVCSLVMHHLISDGWSAHLVQTILGKAVCGEEIHWDKFSGNYVDYVRGANRLVHSTVYEERLNFWRHYLQGITELGLTKLNINQETSISGNVYSCPISSAVSDKINAFCSRYAYTPFVFFYAVFMMLLSRWCKQTDFAVGFPYWGREQHQDRWIIGYFVHILLLRYQKEYTQLTFIQYIENIKSHLLAVEEHAISYDKIADIARSQFEKNDIQLVKAIFTYEEKALFHDYLKRDKSAFELVLNVLTNGEKAVCCRVEYRNENFAEEDIQRFMSAYQVLLETVVEHSDTALCAYSLASAEYCQNIISLNELSGKISQQIPFLIYFAQTVRQYPQQMALVCGEDNMTYQELNQRSDEIMSIIRSAGISLGANIAVSMLPSVDCIVTIIGILKSGCCYVPIAVDLPEERKEFILKDASCCMLFHEGNEYIFLETYQSCTEEVGLNNAYIIYTSGTTGRPKGVPITHQSLSRLIETEISDLNLSVSSRGLLFASISFDASVLEIFPILSVGATLVIALPEQRNDPVLLADLMEKEAVTCAVIPPALLPLLPHREFPVLDSLVLGGETTSLSALEYWHKGHKVFNAYGPTENTVETTMCIVEDDFEPNDIGLPLPGVSCYVLDEYLNIVPENLVGELYIGGLQLTPGYLHRPDLNREKFVCNPYVTLEDKARKVNLTLYKTGDLVKRRSNGHLIFMGRIDNQVKIRGFRIELSEIEAQLQQCEGVQNALVEVQKKDTQSELVAFVQPCLGASPDIAKIQADLRKKLPYYMIPAKWAVIEQFPLTINGKIDRHRLPEPNVVVDVDIVEAKTEDEKILLEMVRDILGTDAIGVETDLFDAGMTSMQVMEFVGRIVSDSNLRITVSAVYKNRTIKKILQEKDGKSYFWLNRDEKEKPVMVFICGFADVSPFYDDILSFFTRSFSVLVLDSYCNPAVDEPADLNQLLRDYDKALSQLLEGRSVAVLTGYCSGAEMAFVLANYLHEKYPERPFYNVLNMEAVYHREMADLDGLERDEVLLRRVRIMNKLYRDFPPLEYDGPVLNVMAGNVTYLLYPEIGEETDPEVRSRLYYAWRTNKESWRQHYPHAPYYELDCNHWTFFEEKNLEELREIIRKHWNI